MLLTLDIGNTSTTIGLFDNNRLVETWSIASEKNRSEDEIGILLLNLLKIHDYEDKVQNACLCSVVVCLTERYKNAIKRYLGIKPFVVSNKTINLLNYKIDNPEELGADRIVNAFAAYQKYGKTAIVVDMGTATSFDIVKSNGEFIGGVICAGMKIQAESLKKFTSKLPLIKIEAPKNAIGTNTIDAMLSGIVRGHACMIDGLIKECEKELNEKALIIATGGYSEIISQYMERKFDFIMPNLTLEGLKHIYQTHSFDANDSSGSSIV